MRVFTAVAAGDLPRLEDALECVGSPNSKELKLLCGNRAKKKREKRNRELMDSKCKGRNVFVDCGSRKRAKDSADNSSPGAERDKRNKKRGPERHRPEHKKHFHDNDHNKDRPHKDNVHYQFPN